MTYGTFLLENWLRNVSLANGGAWSPTMTKTVGRASGANAVRATDSLTLATSWNHEQSDALWTRLALMAQEAAARRSLGTGAGRCELSVTQ